MREAPAGAARRRGPALMQRFGPSVSSIALGTVARLPTQLERQPHTCYISRLTLAYPSAGRKIFRVEDHRPGASIFPGQIQHLFESMTTIRVKENEPFDVALRRFKRTIEKLGLLPELRAREFYEKPTAERKRKKAAAVKRHYKRVRSMQLPKRLY